MPKHRHDWNGQVGPGVVEFVITAPGLRQPFGWRKENRVSSRLRSSSAGTDQAIRIVVPFRCGVPALRRAVPMLLPKVGTAKRDSGIFLSRRPTSVDAPLVLRVERQLQFT